MILCEQRKKSSEEKIASELIDMIVHFDISFVKKFLEFSYISFMSS